MDRKDMHTDKEIDGSTWNHIAFDGKAYCLLTNDGQLKLKATSFYPEKTLATVDRQNFEETIQLLRERFQTSEKAVAALDTRWESTEDKSRLETMLHQVHRQLQATDGIGDFVPLFKSVHDKEQALKQFYEINYRRKLQIVTEAETAAADPDLKAAQERINQLFEDWKAALPAEKPKSDALWRRFEHARNTIYQNKHDQQEADNKERMQNLDLKLELAAQAEALASSESWRETTDAFNALMEQWKTIGPVPSPEKNEALWKQFSEARKQFFDRKRQHSASIQQEQEQNFLLKTDLVEKAERLQSQTTWKATAKEFAALMDSWRAIGKVPPEKSEPLWQRLQKARDHFFEAKRNSAQQFREKLEDNYQTKKQLAAQAEALKNATDWSMATKEMNRLMQTWKQCGPIPREYGNELWEQFIQARKHFFNRKDEDREQRKSRYHHQINNRLHQTVQFLNKITKELEEDELKLADFKTALQTTTGSSAKDEELRQHLQTLIGELEHTLPKQRQKIDEVSRQKQELTAKCNEVNGKK